MPPLCANRQDGPPRARARRSSTRYSVARRDGDAAATRLFESAGAKPARQNPAGRWQIAGRARNHHIAAAADGGGAGLIEDHFADAEQHRHHTDAESEAARQHERANGMGQQRSKREPEDHPGDPSRSIRPSRITSVRPARDAIAWSCVTMTMAVPSCCTRSKSSAICSPVARSSSPVGSSASRSTGPVGQRAGNGDPLHFAAGELRRTMMRAMREADVLQKLGSARTPGIAADSSFGLRKLDVLPGGEHGKQKESLKDKPNLRQPHVAASGIGQRADIPAFEEQRAARRRIHTSEDVHQRRLSAAGRSPDGDVFRGFDPKRDAVHRGHRTSGHRKHFGDARERLDNHPITSALSVDEIGSRATVHIGYTAATAIVTASSATYTNQRSRLEHKEAQVRRNPGHRLKKLDRARSKARGREAARQARRLRREAPSATGRR